MYIYKNGDRCPCCGELLQGKSEDWLWMFSLTAHTMGFPAPDQRPASAPVPGFRPAED